MHLSLHGLSTLVPLQTFVATAIYTVLNEVKPFDIQIGDNCGVNVHARGAIQLVLLVVGKLRTCEVGNVFFAPSMGFNLLSVSTMRRAGQNVFFNKDSCRTKKNGRLLAEGTNLDGIYYLNTCITMPTFPLTVVFVADHNLWHQRLAHVHIDGIRSMEWEGVFDGLKAVLAKNKVGLKADLAKNAVGLKADLAKNTDRYEACVFGKSTHAPVPRPGGTGAMNILDFVHTDVCGPFPVPSIGGCRYFVSLLDDRSRFAWMYHIEAKSDVYDRFKEWVPVVENRNSTNIKVLQSDNGGKYTSSSMRLFLEGRGIQKCLTAS